MGLTNKLTDVVQEVDVIIAGGGTAACVVAGRLAEADPGLSILVVEGGPDNYDVPSVVHPLRFPEHLAPTSSSTLFYKTRASEHLAGREAVVPSGGILGGGSSINFMMYTRAQRDDFDSWNMPGWTADEVLPFMKKLETYHGPGDPDRHGQSGPIHVSDGGYGADGPSAAYMRALAAAGRPPARDMQSLDANNCCERSLRYVSPAGRRQDAAHAYLHPRLRDGRHPHLHVLVATRVVRVLFDDEKRARGVEVTPAPALQLATAAAAARPRVVLRARRLVVVSCGANGTPSVLERSGVGGAGALGRAGVPVVADLPGVGAGLQDHHLALLPFRTALAPRETGDAVLAGREGAADLARRGDAMLGWNMVEVGVKTQPLGAEIAALDPVLREAWRRDFRDRPNRPMMLMAIINGFLGDQSALEPGQYVLAANYTAYPYSRGSIHITGPEPDDPVDYDLGFFSDEGDVDLKKQVWAYKRHREIVRRTSWYRGEVAAGHPRFPPGSGAAVEEEGVPAPENADADDPRPLLTYSAEDDAAIERYLRETVQTTWHSLGTCRMAPREAMGVVDANLDVYGVSALKVVDLSIPPENVAANTNNTALVIGEKGADIIIRELGLRKN